MYVRTVSSVVTYMITPSPRQTGGLALTRVAGPQVLGLSNRDLPGDLSAGMGPFGVVVVVFVLLVQCIAMLPAPCAYIRFYMVLVPFAVAELLCQGMR